MVFTEGQYIYQQSVVQAWLHHQVHERLGDRQPWRLGQTAYSSKTEESVKEKRLLKQHTETLT